MTRTDPAASYVSVSFVYSSRSALISTGSAAVGVTERIDWLVLWAEKVGVGVAASVETSTKEERPSTDQEQRSILNP